MGRLFFFSYLCAFYTFGTDFLLLCEIFSTEMLTILFIIDVVFIKEFHMEYVLDWECNTMLLVPWFLGSLIS